MNDIVSMRKMRSVLDVLVFLALTDAVAVATETPLELSAVDFFRGGKQIV
jgi:hypothetical protein